jgi:rubrerythrin
MEKERLDEIIDFAIQREKEAVEFYLGLQHNIHFTERKKLLHNFELMEQGHINALNGIRGQIEKTSIERIVVPEVVNLHISDYIVEQENDGEMEYQDILITAMKREENSFNLYTDLAERSIDPGIKKLLLKLAAEEAQHKLYFERIYDDEILSQD